jgi:hypothetical protein
MNEHMTEAVQAIRRLNPHPRSFARARWAPERDKFEYPISYAELPDAIILKHLRGETILGGVSSDDRGHTNSVGVDMDAHLAGQDPKGATRKFVLAAQAMDVPVLVHTSKSGRGAHVRTLFSEYVPSWLARALFVAVVMAAGLEGDKAVDKVWPPRQGQGVLIFPYQAKCFKEHGGGVALDQNTLRPLPKGQQLSSVLEAPEMSREEAERTLGAMGVRTETDARTIAGCSLMEDGGQRIIKDGTDGGVQYMVERCAAVKRLQDEARSVPYEFWFGMMTNFKPFVGGREIFEAISQLDPARFGARELGRSWNAIRGGPRMCENLDTGWSCPLLGVCPARSPAGLPFGLRRNGKAT